MQFLAIASTAIIGLFSFLTVSTVTIDNSASTVNWKAYKVTGAHEGNISLKSGELTFSDNELTGGEFVIDMATIAITDLTGEYAEKLRGHLNSDDFFGTATHPDATLVITKVKKKMAGQYTITADLTIKGKTHPTTFDATVYQVDGKYIATGNLKVDRSKYDVRYGSGSFFENLGDQTIYDEFDLDIKLVSK